MKKLILLFIIISTITIANLNAQMLNTQLHYETGSFDAGGQEIKRSNFRYNIQMLNRDKLGTYYWSLDMKYSLKDSATFAQLQLFRTFKLPKMKYLQVAVGHAGIVGLNGYYFVGLHHPLKFGKLTLLPLLLYQYNKTAASADVRFMTGYNANLFNDKISIFGFANAFTTDNFNAGEVDGKIIVSSIAPQIFYNLNQTFAVGTQIEANVNKFVRDGKVKVVPSIAVRADFGIFRK